MQGYISAGAGRLNIRMVLGGGDMAFNAQFRAFPAESAAWRTRLEHEWLTVKDDQFDEFAAAISDFWSAMPKRLYYDVTL